MAASGLAEIIMPTLVSAMSAVEVAAMEDMKESIGDFYAGGTPVPWGYVRTYQLKSTPRVSGLYQGGHMVSFDAYLNSAGGYSTGKRPSMATILQHTNYGAVAGLRAAKGAPGYWEKAEMRIQRDLNRILGSYFG